MGVMINASFVFGMDDDDEGVFDRTVEWAIENGLETSTFHILTPYPGTELYTRMSAQNRILTNDWDLYDTRHAVYRPAGMTVETLEDGYWQAYRKFYRWRSIFRSASVKNSATDTIRHLMYTGGWKKFEPFWNVVIKTGKVSKMLPVLESVLSDFGRFTGINSKGIKGVRHEYRSLKGLMNRKFPHQQEGTFELEDTVLKAKENKKCV